MNPPSSVLQELTHAERSLSDFRKSIDLSMKELEKRIAQYSRLLVQPLMDAAEVAEILKIGKAKATALLDPNKKGEIRAIRPANKWVCRPEWLVEYLEAKSRERNNVEYSDEDFYEEETSMQYMQRKARERKAAAKAKQLKPTGTDGKIAQFPGNS